MKSFLFLCLFSSTVLAQSYLDQYTTHREMVRELRQLRVDTQEIGKSRAGKAILAARFGDEDTPAILVVGNVDGDYLVGTELAMRLIRDLASGAIDRQGKTVFVVPMLNPDATDFMLGENGYATTYNSLATDDDHDLTVNEDGPNDLNRDGIISQMRVADPSGLYRVDERNPDLLVKVDPQKNESGTYRLLTEGLDDDGDGLIDEDGFGGVNINKNFTYNYDYFGPGAGENQASEPETRAIMDFVFDHQNILLTLNFSSYDNLHQLWEANRLKVEEYPRPLKALDKMPREDTEAYQLFAHIWKEQHQDWKVSASNRGQGAFHDWAYFHAGRYSIAVNGWNYRQISSADETAEQDIAESEAAQPPATNAAMNGAQNGMAGMPSMGGGAQADRFEQETQARLLADARNKGLQGAALAWTAIEHPDFPNQQVEVGGFNTSYLKNPDKAVYDSTQSSAYVATLASLFPQLEVTQEIEPISNNLHRVTLRIKNVGKLPTQSAMGKLSRWMRPVRVEWSLPKERIISGTKRTLLEPIAPGAELILKWLVNTQGERQARVEVESPVIDPIHLTLSFGA